MTAATAATDFIWGGKIKALVKQIDFETSEHGKGSLFVVSSVFKTMPQIEELIRNMVAAVGHHPHRYGAGAYLVDLPGRHFSS